MDTILNSLCLPFDGSRCVDNPVVTAHCSVRAIWDDMGWYNTCGELPVT